MYAIVIDRDRQIRLQEGESLLLDYNESWEPGSEVVLDQVCVLGGPAPKIGSPYVDGAKVVLEVQGAEKGDKIIVGKFKRRKNYRRKQGFRPMWSRVLVKAIEA